MSENYLYASLDIAERISERASSLDVAVKSMLSELGLNKNTVSDMRRGTAIASNRLAIIADYLDCSVDYLLGRTSNPESHKSGSQAESPPDIAGIIDTLTDFQKGQVVGYIQRMLEGSVAADHIQKEDLGKVYPSTGTEGPGK